MGGTNKNKAFNPRSPLIHSMWYSETEKRLQFPDMQKTDVTIMTLFPTQTKEQLSLPPLQLSTHFKHVCLDQHCFGSDLQVVEALEIDVEVGFDAIDGPW